MRLSVDASSARRTVGRVLVLGGDDGLVVGELAVEQAEPELLAGTREAECTLAEVEGDGLAAALEELLEHGQGLAGHEHPGREASLALEAGLGAGEAVAVGGDEPEPLGVGALDLFEVGAVDAPADILGGDAELHLIHEPRQVGLVEGGGGLGLEVGERRVLLGGHPHELEASPSAGDLDALVLAELEVDGAVGEGSDDLEEAGRIDGDLALALDVGGDLALVADLGVGWRSCAGESSRACSSTWERIGCVVRRSMTP